MMKKIFSALLCAAMTLNLLTVNISAEETFAQTVSENEGIIEALRLIEPIRENYGLTEADLENMEVADPIKTYEYTSEGISFLRNYFPLICSDEIAAWAIENIDGNEVFYQISTAYIDEVNEIVDSTKAFALIYDDTACYLYDSLALQKLGSFEKCEGRSALAENVLEISTVELGGISERHDLGYTHGAAMYGAVLPETTYKCNVRYVTQNVGGYENICWSATIACIINYVKNTNYTALSFLADNPDASNGVVDKGLWYGYEVDILKKYGLNYTYSDFSTPSISVIANNIRNNAPIYAVFENERATTHACTMHGCTIDNTNNGAPICVYIMDPLYGEDAAYYSASDYTYKYTNGSTGRHYSLIYMTRKY